MCKCVLYYCHRVATKLQSTNISYIIKTSVRQTNTQFYNLRILSSSCILHVIALSPSSRSLHQDYITTYSNIRFSINIYFPTSRPTDATCDRFLFSIYMCKTLHVSSVKRSSSGVPHRKYSLQFLCLCLSAALSCKKLSYKFLTRQCHRQTQTQKLETMYGEGLLMMRA
jgi:hypothetical protein